MFGTNTDHRARRSPVARLTSAIGGLTAMALVFSGCASAASSQGNSDGADEVSVPAGTSKEEWQDALADIDPVEIVYQAATPSSSSSADGLKAWAEKLEEYSNGNVTVEIVWSYGIASITESDEALLDGRIDSHNYSPFSSPSEFPINGQLMLDATVLRESSPLAGTLALFGAANETAWALPDITAEFTDKGLHPIMPFASAGLTGLACSEPVTGLDDLQGKLIRTGPQVQVAQVEALGATSVTLPFTELYEALQRGIVDCILYGVSGLAEGGLLEVAPYVTTAAGTSFATMTATETTGINWESWPLALKQLHFDTLNEYTISNVDESMSMLDDVSEQAKANGGGFFVLDDDTNAVLEEHNEEVFSNLSGTDLLDGESFTGTYRTQFEEWTKLVEDAGYSSATLVDFDDELAGEDTDLSAYLDIYRERVLEPNRPE